MEKSDKYAVDILKSSSSFIDWDNFVDESPYGSIFCRSWWLKAVCPEGFEILTLRRGNDICAGMPLVTFRKWGYTTIHMPQLTQALGVLLRPSNKEKYEKRLSYEMDILSSLIEAMPRFDHFSVNFHYNFTNWLPFYWTGYEQTTRYTYVLPDLTDLEHIFSDFSHMKRKNIKKAEQIVKIYEDLSSESFYANHKMTLFKQHEVISYSYDLFKRIYDAAYKNRAGKVWYAVDDKQNIHAAIFIIFDSKSAYYFISSIDPEYGDSGAATLLLKRAITYASQFTKRFDFEGSMIKGVEKSFRKFGAIQTPYFNISKDNRPLYLKVCYRLYRKAGEALHRLCNRRNKG